MKAGEISGALRRRRRGWATALAVALTAGLLVTTGATAQADVPVRMPSDPHGLRAPARLTGALDPVPAYVPQTSCSPTEKRGVARLRKLVLRTYGRGHTGGSVRLCSAADSEHLEGRAWDWMLDPRSKRDRRAAGDFLAWLTRRDGENARRLGIMYVIYNKKIWASYRSQDGWRKSWGHEDHVHVSFSWDGANGRTSFWRGRALSRQDLGPCASFTGTFAALPAGRRVGDCAVRPVAPLRTSRLAERAYGHTGDAVRIGQKLLRVRQTGTFDARTWKAVRRYQKRADLPVTGVLDHATWASLSPAHVRSDVTAGLTGPAAGRLAKAHFVDHVLAKGRSVGRDVITLQVALGMPRSRVNGYFGAHTRVAVKRFQKSRGLRATGVVDAATWRALPS